MVPPQFTRHVSCQLLAMVVLRIRRKTTPPQRASNLDVSAPNAGESRKFDAEQAGAGEVRRVIMNEMCIKIHSSSANINESMNYDEASRMGESPRRGITRLPLSCAFGCHGDLYPTGPSGAWTNSVSQCTHNWSTLKSSPTLRQVVFSPHLGTGSERRFLLLTDQAF